MNIKNILLVVICLLLSPLSFSQAVAGEPNQYESSWRLKQVIRDKLNTQERSNPIAFEDIKGSPYLNEKFQTGEYVLNGESQGLFYLRYNVYNDQVEILTDASPENFNSDNPKFEAFLKLDNSEVHLDGHTIKSFYYNDEHGNTSNSYFIVVNETEKYTLLLRKRCVLTPAEKAANPNQTDRAAKFTIYDDYYLLSKEEAYPKKLVLKKRHFLKAFPDKADALKAYMKREDVNLKEQSDLIALTDYLTTLSL